jgi:hypothetical protein
MSPTNLINDYRDFILDHIPTSKGWAEDCALAMVSICCGPKKLLMGPGGLRLNLFFLCIGPSGIANKTLPLKYVVSPTLEKLSAELKKDLVFPTRFSIEGLVTWYADVSPEGGFVRDEFTGILKETTKGYLGDMLEFLSELYDGTLQKRFTIKYKLKEVKKVYLTFLSATTPYLYKIMKPDFYVQGTGNRIITRLFDIDTIPEESREIEYWRANLEKHQIQADRICEFSKKFANLYRCNPRTLAMDEDATKLWVEYKNKIGDKIKEIFRKDDMDIHCSYMARMAEMAAKLSAINLLSRKYDLFLIKDAPKFSIVEREDVEYGIKREEQALEDFNKMLFKWRRHNREEATVYTETSQVRQYVSVLAVAPNKMYNVTDWNDNCDLKFNPETAQTWRQKATARGWIRLVSRDEVTDPEEVKRLWTGPNSHVYTVTEAFLNS